MNQENKTLTTMNEENQPMSYVDVLRETQQAEFPLLGEVTQGFVGDPLHLMNAITDEEDTVVPCALRPARSDAPVPAPDDERAAEHV